MQLTPARVGEGVDRGLGRGIGLLRGDDGCPRGDGLRGVRVP